MSRSNLPSAGFINAQIKWLEKHRAIERNNCLRRVARNAMHRHTMDEVLSGLDGIHATIVALRDSTQARPAGAEMPRIIAFAIDCARSDLECHCISIDPDTGESQLAGWYDLTHCLPGGKDHEFMADALWILHLHDQIINHPTKPHLARLKPANNT